MSKKYTYTFNDGVVVMSNKPVEDLKYNLIPLVDTTRLHIAAMGYAKNLCMLRSGTLVPARGHNATDCNWIYDGQVFYHV